MQCPRHQSKKQMHQLNYFLPEGVKNKKTQKNLLCMEDYFIGRFGTLGLLPGKLRLMENWSTTRLHGLLVSKDKEVN